jgi:DNA-binding winged helix-turn-helix (wHTH) protein
VPVILTGKEYSILEILATKNGIVPKEALLNYLYGGLEEVPETKIIDVFVCKLRKKLIQASDGIDLIQTVWGRGYQLNRNIGDDSDSIIQSNVSEVGDNFMKSSSEINFLDPEIDNFTNNIGKNTNFLKSLDEQIIKDNFEESFLQKNKEFMSEKDI